MIVTPEQFRGGYLELTGMLVLNYPFRVIQRLDDGNYLVEDPHE